MSNKKASVIDPRQSSIMLALSTKKRSQLIDDHLPLREVILKSTFLQECFDSIVRTLTQTCYLKTRTKEQRAIVVDRVTDVLIMILKNEDSSYMWYKACVANLLFEKGITLENIRKEYFRVRSMK
jgi:hypothetical protein